MKFTYDEELYVESMLSMIDHFNTNNSDKKIWLLFYNDNDGYGNRCTIKCNKSTIFPDQSIEHAYFVVAGMCNYDEYVVRAKVR